MKARNGIVAITAAALMMMGALPASAQPEPLQGPEAPVPGEIIEVPDAPEGIQTRDVTRQFPKAGISNLATDRLPPIARSWRVLNGNTQVLGVAMARAVIQVQGDELVLTSSGASGLRFKATGPLQPDAEGAYVFKTTIKYRKGMLGGLLNFDDPVDQQVEMRFRLDADRFQFTGETYVDGDLVGRPRLIRRKRALIAYSRVRPDERFYMFRHRVWTASYYSGKGYQVVQRQCDRVEVMIAALEEAGKENDPYDRVVMIGHGGLDGVVFGFGYRKGGARQVGPNESQALWPALVHAVQVGTTPNAVMLASGCSTGAGEYVSDLAGDTGRTVVGPTSLTSFHRTQPHAKAMEGDGEFLQQMIIARGDKVWSIGESGELSDDPGMSGRVVVKPPARIPDKVARGRMVYTFNGGWVDVGHAGFLSSVSGQKMLINRVLGESGLSIGEDHYKLTYSQGMGPSWLSGNWFTTTGRDFVIKKGLTRDQKLQVALAIFMEVSEAFESHQGDLWGVTRITESSFSEDDLVSNVLGFYAAVHDLSKEQVMEMLDPATVQESARVWELTEGPGKNKAWVPVDHNHLLGRPPMEFPELFTSITPATMGGELVRRAAD